MLYEISKALQTEINAKGVPFVVKYGPERTNGGVTNERIVLDEAEDTYSPSVSQHRNPRSPMTNQAGAVLRVYARSALVGAAVQDHRRRARDVADRAIVALDKIIRGTRRSQWTVAGGRWLAPEESTESETWGGAIYELRFFVARAVLDTTWAGDARPTSEALTFSSTTQSRIATAAGETAETACGA